MTTGWIVVDVLLTLVLVGLLVRSESRRHRLQWVVNDVRKELEHSFSAMLRPTSDPHRSVAIESGVVGAIASLDVHDGAKARAARQRQLDDRLGQTARVVTTTIRDVEKR